MQHVLPRKTNSGRQERRRAPAIVLAVPNVPQVHELRAVFQEHGYEVHLAHTPTDVRRLVREVSPVVSILSAETDRFESGWLTCKKVTMSEPKSRVVLLGNKNSTRSERLAQFVGAAAYITSGTSASNVAKLALGTDLSSHL